MATVLRDSGGRLWKETRRRAQDGGSGGRSGVTGEGGPGRFRFLERPPGTSRKPGPKTHLQDGCAWTPAPPARNRRSGLTWGETIVDSLWGGGLVDRTRGAKLWGMVSPAVCGRAPAQSWLSVGGARRNGAWIGVCCAGIPS